MITLEHINKIYKSNKKQTVALSDVCFHIPEGKIVGLIGFNGAGKSTLIKILTKVIQPTSGKVTYSHDIDKNKKVFLNSIGVMFSQKSVLLYDVPIKYSIEFYQKVYHLSNEQIAQSYELMHLLAIDELLEMPVRKLSFGQRMKCELFVSVMYNPKILFLDEPTIGIDARSKEEIMSFLMHQNKTYGTTILYTSHDLKSVEKICDQIILLDHGKVAYEGNSIDFMNRKDYKIIDISYTGSIDTSLFSNIVMENDHQLRIQVEKVNLDSVIELLVDNENIEDFNISTPDLEYILTRKE